MYIIVPLIHAALWNIALYKWGDWKGWNKYYSTILFLVLGNMIYNIVFHDKPLWLYNSPISHILNDFFYSITIFPCVVLLFIPHLPKVWFGQILYIFVWVFIFTGLEILYKQMNLILYFNGWNIWWSAIHNIYQFALLKIHHRRPILAWTISFAILVIIIGIFKPPLIR